MSCTPCSDVIKDSESYNVNWNTYTGPYVARGIVLLSMGRTKSEVAGVTRRPNRS
jgi:hypothetical protein